MKNIYTYENYDLFVGDSTCQNYLILEENGNYTHLVFEWDLSDTEITAIAHKFYTVGLTDDDFCDWDWEKGNFREDYNSFYRVERPTIKVYVNDCGDAVLLLHMDENYNMWITMEQDEDTVDFLLSYAEGNGKWESMEGFQHFLDRMYYTDEEIEEAFEGLELVGENYILSDKVTEEWPVYSFLKRGGFHYTTERIATIHGHVPTQEDLDNIASYMDDECREDLHMEIAPCTPEYFLSEYIWKYSNSDPDFYSILEDEFGFRWAILK